MPKGRIAIPVLERYMPVTESGCWLFTGMIKDTGYGLITRKINKKVQYIPAHRAAWIEAYGHIPEGMLVCHKCDVRSYINPSHLFLGSYKDNSQDMKKKGRNRNGVSYGKKGGPRLDEQTIKDIRISLDNGESNRAVARKFNISATHVHNIKFRRDWKNL